MAYEISEKYKLNDGGSIVMNLDTKKIFKKVIKIFIALWIIFIVLGTIYMIINKNNSTEINKINETYISQQKDSFNIKVGATSLEVDGDNNITANIYEIPNDVEILNSFGSKIAYSTIVKVDGDYVGNYDLNIYDAETGEIIKIKDMDSETNVYSCMLNEKYIIWEENSSLVVKDIKSNEMVITIESFEQAHLNNNYLYYYLNGELIEVNLQNNEIKSLVQSEELVDLSPRKIVANDKYIVMYFEGYIFNYDKEKNNFNIKKLDYDERSVEISIEENKVYIIEATLMNSKIFDLNTKDLKDFNITDDIDILDVYSYEMIVPNYLAIKANSDNMLKVLKLSTSEIINLYIPMIQGDAYSVSVQGNNLIVKESTDAYEDKFRFLININY